MMLARSRPVVFLLTLSLAAGCRSEQVAFRFNAPVGAGPGALTRPAQSASASPAAADTPTPAAEPVATQGALMATVPAAPAPTQHSGSHMARARVRHLLALSPLASPAAVPDVAGPLRLHRRAVGALARTQHTTEAGLGGVALFFIGVTLAVLAGLAVLVNLLFGVGFFTALGYTAAGLEVLFLLYKLLNKLLSPKKSVKKKA